MNRWATLSIPSELSLDRYLLGEASVEECRSVELWLADDPAALALLARRKSEASAAFGTVPTFVDLSRKVASGKAPSKRGIFPYQLAGVAAVLVFAVLLLPRVPSETNFTEGEPTFCMLKHGDSVRRVSAVDTCTPGDTLQVYSVAAQEQWVMVLFAEKNGRFKPCPGNDTAIHLMVAATAVPIPFSIVVDTGQGGLALAVATSARKFNAGRAVSALQKGDGAHPAFIRYQLMRK